MTLPSLAAVQAAPARLARRSGPTRSMSAGSTRCCSTIRARSRGGRFRPRQSRSIRAGWPRSAGRRNGCAGRRSSPAPGRPRWPPRCPALAGRPAGRAAGRARRHRLPGHRGACGRGSAGRPAGSGGAGGGRAGAGRRDPRRAAAQAGRLAGSARADVPPNGSRAAPPSTASSTGTRSACRPRSTGSTWPAGRWLAGRRCSPWSPRRGWTRAARLPCSTSPRAAWRTTCWRWPAGPESSRLSGSCRGTCPA